MTTRKAVAVNVDASQAEFIEAVKVQNAPMVQRLASTRDMIDQRIKALESERFDFQTRRDLVRRQAEAVDAGFVIHLEDIEAAIKLLESGLNSIGVPKD